LCFFTLSPRDPLPTQTQSFCCSHFFLGLLPQGLTPSLAPTSVSDNPRHLFFFWGTPPPSSPRNWVWRFLCLVFCFDIDKPSLGLLFVAFPAFIPLFPLLFPPSVGEVSPLPFPSWPPKPPFCTASRVFSFFFSPPGVSFFQAFRVTV